LSDSGISFEQAQSIPSHRALEKSVFVHSWTAEVH